MPQRIQRKRSKGWKMPEGAVYVGRPTIWGNPWMLKAFDPDSGGFIMRPAHEVVRYYRKWVEANLQPSAKFPLPLHELRGKDLACWCPLVDKYGRHVPCHADVLLEIANK